MENPKMVIIEWNDVASMDLGLIESRDLEEIKPPVARLIGFLVRETTKAYYLAKEYWPETKQFKYVHVIPKKTAIISISNLKVSNNVM